jgi:hypothetical protein
LDGDMVLRKIVQKIENSGYFSVSAFRQMPLAGEMLFTRMRLKFQSSPVNMLVVQVV